MSYEKQEHYNIPCLVELSVNMLPLKGMLEDSVPTFHTLPVLQVFKNYCPFVEEQYYIHILSSGFMQILLITYFYADLIILYSTLWIFT